MRLLLKTTPFLLLLPLLMGVSSFQDTNNFMRSKEKPRVLDREALKREITETLALIEALSLELKAAGAAATQEVWDSGPRDFKLKSASITVCKDASVLMIQALNLESGGDPKLVDPANGLRAKARKRIAGMHKEAPESFLRDLRNWLMVSEGDLRRAREKAAKPTPTPTPAK